MNPRYGLWELVLVGLLALSIYALYLKVTRHDPVPVPVPLPVPDSGSVPAPDQPVPAAVAEDPAPELEPEPPVVEAPAIPESLDAPMIKSAVAAVLEPIRACGDRFPDASGLVKLGVKVHPDGTVAKVDVIDTDSRRLGACAADAMRDATFPATQRGGSFSYPFRFEPR